MTAPPPEDPESGPDQGEPELDFDAEFDRIVSGWTPPPAETDEAPTDPAPATSAAEPAATPEESLRDLFRGAWPDEDSAAPAAPADREEHFEPPPAPPIPRPQPPRLAAWAGLLVAPLLGLALLVVGALPSLVAVALFCWFVGGFAYLVATMDSRRDGWDDGARL